MRIGTVVMAAKDIRWHPGQVAPKGARGVVVHEKGKNDAGDTVDFGDHGVTAVLDGEVESVEE